MERTLRLLLFGTFLINVASSQTDTANYVRKYTLVTSETRTWLEAQRLCRDKYDDLATVANQEDLNKIAGMPESRTGAFWIGLNYDPSTWRWSDPRVEGELGPFRPWYLNQPDNRGGVEYCASALAIGDWRDGDCYGTLPFICVDERGEYVLVAEGKTWPGAQSYCRTHHEDLVSVRSPGDKDKVIQALQSDGSVPEVWIGLSRNPWVWSDGSSVSFTSWMTSQPNSYGSQPCVYMQNGHWNDYGCDSKHYILCQELLPKKEMFVVKVNISSDANLNLPAEKDSLLHRFQARLEEEGAAGFNISWRAERNGLVFQRQKEEDAGRP
ncbi:macrophage mannose receptor 1-like isoform 1-T1 [Menidia menidia]